MLYSILMRLRRALDDLEWVEILGPGKADATVPEYAAYREVIEELEAYLKVESLPQNAVEVKAQKSKH